MSDIAALPRAEAPVDAPAKGRSETAAALVWQWRRGPAVDPRPRQAARARRKALLGGAIGLLVAAALYFWRPGMAAVVAAIAVVLTLLALVSPLGAYARVERGLQLFARGVGVTLTWVLLGLAWVLMFLPLGLFLRATRKLRITKAPAAELPSYWSAATAVAPGIEPYKKPF